MRNGGRSSGASSLASVRSCSFRMMWLSARRVSPPPPIRRAESGECTRKSFWGPMESSSIRSTAIPSRSKKSRISAETLSIHPLYRIPFPEGSGGCELALNTAPDEQFLEDANHVVRDPVEGDGSGKPPPENGNERGETILELDPVTAREVVFEARGFCLRQRRPQRRKRDLCILGEARKRGQNSIVCFGQI